VCLEIDDGSQIRIDKIFRIIEELDLTVVERAGPSVTRDWLRASSSRSMPGGSEIHRQFRRFKRQLPAPCRALRLKPAEMTFNDLTNIIVEWLRTAR
jgi:hypothetical protein